MDAQQLDLFEKYRAGKMNQTEMKDFEERLHNELGFDEAYQLFMLAAESAEYLAYKDLKSKLRNAHMGNTKTVKNYRRKWAIAATILILLGVLLFKGWQYASPQLADRYALEPRFSNSRSDEMSDWTEIKGLLEEGAYVRVLNDLSWRTLDDPFSSLVRGYALLKSDQPEAAIKVFSDLGKTSSIYQQQAQFQLAVAHLQAGETPEAISRLDEIADHPDHDYSTVAQDLLKDLNRCWRWFSL